MTRPVSDAGGLRKRSLTISGHRTSVSLEDAYWEALHAIAAEQGSSVQAIVRSIDENRTATLSSAIRIFVLNHYRKPKGDGPKTKAAKHHSAPPESRPLARAAKS